jgi:hypothetical protein
MAKTTIHLRRDRSKSGAIKLEKTVRKQLRTRQE